MFNNIIEMAEGMQAELTSQRRDLHHYAESGWFEVRTSSIIARRLTDLGYKVLVGKDVCDEASRMGLPSEEELEENYKRAMAQGADPEFADAAKDGFTGVIGILECGEGPTVALRFDIDALGVFESTNNEHRPFKEGFASVNTGMMHACGHDGHTTIGLGTAKVLMSLRDKLHGTVKLIFQPAEEGVRGAKSIVEKGHLDGVDYVLGAHLGGGNVDMPFQIGAGKGGSLATSKFDVIFHGKPSHAAASPELGNNAMLSAATAVLNLHAIPRHGSSPTLVNVGKLTAGTGRNVICDNAKLEIEVRGNTSEANQFMQDYALRIVKAAAEMHGCTVEIKMMGGAESTQNTLELSERVRQVCGEMLGLRTTTPPENGATGSEDYSFMSERVQKNGGQSCYFNNMIRCYGPFHNSLFDFEETALVTGVKAFSGIVYDLLK